jgi:hypothetical protein
MTETIKQYVERRINEGARLEDVWRETEREFPYQCVGWNYVQNIARKMKRSPSPQQEINMPTLKWTPWIRWNNLIAITTLCGFTDGEPPRGAFRLKKKLDALVAQGLAEIQKDGTAQSAKAEYRFVVTPQDEPAIVITVPSLDDAERFLND